MHCFFSHELDASLVLVLLLGHVRVRLARLVSHIPVVLGNEILLVDQLLQVLSANGVGVFSADLDSL